MTVALICMAYVLMAPISSYLCSKMAGRAVSEDLVVFWICFFLWPIGLLIFTCLWAADKGAGK